MKTYRHSYNSKPRWRVAALAGAVSFALVFGSVGAFGADGESDSGIFRRNVSKTPTLTTNKAKIGFSAPAYSGAAYQDSDFNLTVLLEPLSDENDNLYCEAGILTDDGKCMVQPLVVTYVDENGLTGAFDTWGAVSMDAGATWKRTNLSHSAEKAVEIDGVPFGMGSTAKPALTMYGNNILAAWTSHLCRTGVTNGGDGNQGEVTGEGDPNDLYQINGKQGWVNYADLERPDLGVRPFSCVWSARGVVKPNGTVEWMAAERLTSGRRDAYQLSVAVSGAGFAMAWQEDPKALQPGSAAGPGHGMSGAVTTKKTDIWYSFITKSAFAATCTDCEPNGEMIGNDPDGKPKPAIPMSSPVRISDNAACKVEFDEDDQLIVHGAPICERMCADYGYSEPDENGLQFCMKDEVVLNGDTAASRPNLFMVGKELVIGYEETKGMGFGPNEDPQPADPEDLGKNVIYHYYADFTKVHIDSNDATIDPGTILNLAQTDNNGKPMTTEDGELLYRNARRIRFIKQSKSAVGPSGTVLAAIWREGDEGKGRPADIMMRRAQGGYAPENFVCDATRKVSVKFQDGKLPKGGVPSKERDVCVAGVQNLSSPQYQKLEWPDAVNADDMDDDPLSEGGRIPKVTNWTYHAHNLADDPDDNPYDDARAHRGILRGDMLIAMYTWTPNWAAARNGNDMYDVYVRRSFDGGKTTTNVKGSFEQPKNLSHLRESYSEENPDGIGNGRGLTAIEPRLVASPSTYDGSPGKPSDKQNRNPDDTQNTMIYFVAYGTSTNPDLNVQDEPEEDAIPQDLHWSYSDNLGETYYHEFNENNERWEFPGMGNMSRDSETRLSYVQEGEMQLRTNPSGTVLYASWLAETDPVCAGAGHENCGPCAPGQDPGSDVCFRKIEGIDPLSRYNADGDIDGVIDEADEALLAGALKKYDGALDFNEDGKVDKTVDEVLWEEARYQYCLRPDAVNCP